MKKTVAPFDVAASGLDFAQPEVAKNAASNRATNPVTANFILFFIYNSLFTIETFRFFIFRLVLRATLISVVV